MSIKLTNPIELCLEEIEVDDYIPSIKFNFSVNVGQFSHFLKYSGEVWINCNELDVFLSNLNGLEEVATLKDMNNSFLIQVAKQQNHIQFLWSASREGVTKDIISASYNTKISNDIFLKIKDEFMNYPKWW